MYLEGSVISFTELGDEYKGIILEKRKDSSLEVLDIYGSIKTIYKDDVIRTEDEIKINEINNLLKYYNHHLEAKRQDEIIIQYQMELNEINEKYRNKINNIRWKIENINKAKEDIIENLDVYTYKKLNEKLNEFLDNKAMGYEIFTDFTHSVKSVVFNRLYTLKEEGSFHIEDFDFIECYDGNAYTQDIQDWSEKSKLQAQLLIEEIDKKLKIDKSILTKNTLKIEDRIIYGGALKDLTLERNYIFTPKNFNNKKEYIDEIFRDIGNFAKEYLIETNNEVKFPWQENSNNINDYKKAFPWRNDEN